MRVSVPAVLALASVALFCCVATTTVTGTSNVPSMNAMQPGLTPINLGLVQMTQEQRLAMVAKKVVCPFVGSLVAEGKLTVFNSVEQPLGLIAEIKSLGNSGPGSTLGDVLHVFATGNHDKMLGPDGRTLTRQVPAGYFSLDLQGSQGSHPGHSGILAGPPKTVDAGRWSEVEWQRLVGFASGYEKRIIKRSFLAAFIAQNLRRDRDSKVGLNSVWPLVKDAAGVVRHLFNKQTLVERITKTAGENNLVGSSGEFGLLCALLEHSPRTTKLDGEVAFSMADIEPMFRHKRMPDGWTSWKKSGVDWAAHSSALTAKAALAYHRK